MPTRFPGVRLKPLGHPSGRLLRAPRANVPGVRITLPLAIPTEGVGFEPTRAFRPNALAGRRHKPLGHPSTPELSTCAASPVPANKTAKASAAHVRRPFTESRQLARQGSNLESLGPEPSVLPIPPRATSHLEGRGSEYTETVCLYQPYERRSRGVPASCWSPSPVIRKRSGQDTIPLLPGDQPGS